MKKRIFALLMACVMTLGMAVTAFAEDTADPNSMTVEGEIKAPTINVVVPTASTLVINPYRMDVELDGDTVNDQVVSATYFLESSSDIAINVSATVTGTLGENSTAKFATSAPKEGDTAKSLFLYFEIDNAVDGSTAPTWATAYDKTSSKQLVVGAKAATKSNMITLAAGDEAATYAAFRLTGSASSASTLGWNENDTVTVTIAFTFTAVANAAAGSDDATE